MTDDYGFAPIGGDPPPVGGLAQAVKPSATEAV